MAWGKLSSNDWSSGTDIDSDTFVPKKFIQMMFNTFSAGTNRQSLRFGDPTVDSGNNYSERGSDNGAADGTDTSKNHIIAHTGGKSEFAICYMINIETEEKLIIGLVVNGSENGAGNAPNRREFTSKYAETTNQQTVIRVFDTTADFTGGNHSDLGSDVTPAAAIPFAENAQVGSRAEITDTRKIYHYEDPLTFEDDFSSDNWTDSDSTIVGVGTNVLDFQGKDGNFDEVSYKSTTIGTDADFVYRMKMSPTTITQTGNTDSVRVVFGLSNVDDTVFESGRDEVGIVWRVTDTINKFYAFTADGSQIPYSGTDFSLTPTTTDYYLEIVGNAGTYTFNIYSDEYVTLTETKSITDTGLVLDKLVVRAKTHTTTNNQAQGTVDDVEFYNGVTSAGNAWSEEGT